MNTASATATAREKDASRNAFTTAGFAQHQINQILNGPESGATTVDHLLALLTVIEVDSDLNVKLLRSRTLKTRTTGSKPSCGYTVPYQIANLITAPDRKTAASCLRALLLNIDKDPWALDDALDFVTSQISRSAGKKPRLKH